MDLWGGKAKNATSPVKYAFPKESFGSGKLNMPFPKGSSKGVPGIFGAGKVNMPSGRINMLSGKWKWLREDKTCSREEWKWLRESKTCYFPSGIWTIPIKRCCFPSGIWTIPIKTGYLNYANSMPIRSEGFLWKWFSEGVHSQRSQGLLSKGILRIGGCLVQRTPSERYGPSGWGDFCGHKWLPQIYIHE